MVIIDGICSFLYDKSTTNNSYKKKLRVRLSSLIASERFPLKKSLVLFIRKKAYLSKILYNALKKEYSYF